MWEPLGKDIKDTHTHPPELALADFTKYKTST